MTNKEALLGLNFEELKQKIEGLPEYRVRQILRWLNLGVDIENMSDLPKNLREDLALRFVSMPEKIIDRIEAKDGTVKYLYKFLDGNLAEGVKMSYKHGDTLCVSTQIGCRMKCVFCASGKEGLVRNLTAAEILGQVVAVNAENGGETKDKRAITNIVLMGMGEPLDNYDNTTAFIKKVTDKDGLNFSQRNISLSTCGIAPNIKRLADDGFSANLTLSLHSADDEKRKAMMPIAKKYSLAETIEACRYYFDITGRRVIFEYVLVKNENMTKTDAMLLSRLCKNMSVHINLIMLNSVSGSEIVPCTRQEAESFLVQLKQLGISATIRRSMGSDIEGACGQLRAKFGECKKD